MKFTYSWLNDHLETSEKLEAISEKLTSIGLEVERVENRAEKLSSFKVAQIIEAKPHPNADKLRLCTVDSGNEKLQIVCGAANARSGIKVVLAPIGASIPANGMVIKKTSIRGVESNGMLCSSEELGLDQESEGIIELPDTAKIGESFAKAAGLEDPLIEIAITPNRGDCLGVYGIARDLSAAGAGKLKKLKVDKVPGTFDSPVKIKIEDERACPAFIGRYFRGLKNGKSPDWLQNRLKAIGLRPISALVDITNYITYDLGRPLHVYDAKKLNGGLVARKAKNGENILALNGKEYTLDNEIIVIADQKSPVAIGGVIGGESSGCSMETTEVFLEIALFNPTEVAKSGRKLQIDSDSRYRFERNVDPEFLPDAAEIATRLIIELCGGETSKLEVAGKIPSVKRKIDFDFGKVKKLGGVDIDKGHAMQILQFLGFEVKEHSAKFDVTIPSWRSDVGNEADLVEEILRINGYDKIPVNYLEKPHHRNPAVSPRQDLTSRIRRKLAVRGIAETVNFSFIDSQLSKNFIAADDDLRIMNPISSELDIMRQTLIPGLLKSVEKNANRGYENLALYEIGPQFSSKEKDMQRFVAAGIRSGLSAAKNLYKDSRPVDLFDVKADILSCIAESANPDSTKISRDCPPWYHPGKSGSVILGKTVLGYFGDIHPAILKKMDINIPVVAFELFVEALPLPKSQKSKGRLLASNFQHIDRDFAFIIDEKISAEEIINAIRNIDKALIEQVNIFDIYQGKNVEPGKKSVAFSVRVQAMDRTLNQSEIDSLSNKIIAEISSKFGGILRN